MKTNRTDLLAVAAVVALVALTLPGTALAQPVPLGGPLINAANTIADYIVRFLGPVLLVIAVALAAISWAFGNPEGFKRAGYAAGGALLLFGARTLINWLASIAY